MNHLSLILVLGLVVLAVPSWADMSKLPVKSNCAPVTAAPSSWEIALCQLPEKNGHYPTEFRVSRKGHRQFTYRYLTGPTDGYAEANILAATERFMLLEIPGDEANQVLGFDLKKKAVVLNTGKVVGMRSCTFRALNEKSFCSVSLKCPVGYDDDPSKNYAASISEFLCPK
jgi:hypothetical protein